MVACPRCGYDLHGQVDAWHPGLTAPSQHVQLSSAGSVVIRDQDVGAKCPVEGMCSECGLTFEWVNVFFSERNFAGVFELDRTSRWKSLRITLWRGLFAKRLWKSLVMHHPIRLWRMAIVAATYLLVPGVIPGLLVFLWNWLPFSMRYTSTRGFVFNRSRYWYWSRESLLDHLTWYLPDHGWGWSSVWAQISIGMWLLMPFVFLLMPISFHKAKIRHVHLTRGVAYGCAWAMLSMILPACIVWSCDKLFGWNGLVPPAFSFWTYDAPLQQSPWLWGISSMVFAAAWWSIFARDYLRLPRPWLIGIVLAIMSFVIAFGLVFVVGQSEELASTLI